MKSAWIIVLFFVIGSVAVVIYSLQSGTQTPTEYRDEIQRDRDEKELFMKNSKDSPFHAAGEFKGLKYFPPDLKYKITGVVNPIENKKVVRLPMSDGKHEDYLEYGFAEFELDGIKNKLLILEVITPEHSGTLFLAFSDNTSAQTTYGAGRYLELKNKPGSSSIILDFNKAYNPYCAYSDNYSCPFPPKENMLKVDIKAGEKLYHDLSTQ
jgi:uncharacterized protein (DUF1684 family)